MPVKSKERLYPGQQVGFDAANFGFVSASGKKVGVVDPFLSEPILPGQMVWVLMYPNSVTGLRHDWDHPDLVAPAPVNDEVDDVDIDVNGGHVYDECRNC